MSKCTALFVNLQYLKEEEEEERMVDENLEVSEEGGDVLGEERDRPKYEEPGAPVSFISLSLSSVKYLCILIKESLKAW